MEPGIAVRALESVVAGLEALGHDAQALVAAAGIDAAVLADPEGRVPHSEALALWREGVARTGDDLLGLHVAEAAPVDSFDVHAYAVVSSATLREGFGRACRYQRLIHEATQLTLAPDGDVEVLRHALPGGRPVPRQSAEFLLTAYVRLGRLAAGRDWVPREVRFAHAAPADTAEHARVFGAPLRFEAGENSLAIAPEVLDAPNPGADAGLLKVLDRHASDLLARVPVSSALSDRVRAFLLDAFGEGTPTAADAAGRLKMSARTLSRGLRAEGTTFKELLDQLRHERATALLADGRTSIAEVAYLLGFSDVSAFYRAFKRWTGATPAEFRGRG